MQAHMLMHLPMHMVMFLCVTFDDELLPHADSAPCDLHVLDGGWGWQFGF